MEVAFKSRKDRGVEPDQTPRAAPAPSGTAGVPAPPKRQRNTGWMIGGAALVLLSGLIAASVVTSLSQSVDVLVASRTITKGSIIVAEDLRSVSIAADTGALQAIDPSRANDLVGRLAAGPIGEGSILHPDQFTSSVDLAEEATVVVGAALSLNDVPVLSLLPGDEVRLFETSGVSFGGDADTSSAVAREITQGEVVEVTRVNSNTVHVAIRIRESNANLVTNRIDQQRISIALLDSTRTSGDEVVPLDPAAPLEPLAPGVDG